MAADKIYVHVRTKPRPSITFSEALEENSSNIAYIRKDALLEWAKERIPKYSDSEAPLSAGYIMALNELIEKLNSM